MTARLDRVALDWTLAPPDAAVLVRGDAHPVVLAGDWAGGGAVIAAEPVRIARPDEDPFALLDEQPPVEGAGGVGGGWLGMLGFGLGRRLERLMAAPPRPVALPEFALAYYDHVLRLDADGRWWFESLSTPARVDALRSRLAEFERRAADGRGPAPFSTGPWAPVPGWSGHAAAVAACRERIHAGDLFQANVCVRLGSALDGDPLDLFCAGVSALRPARAAYVAGPWGAVASLSPELFLARRGREVRSEPIKGTRRRPADPAADERARLELAAAEKDRAENVMIVDLVRNDLGRVCEPGSVRVPVLWDVRAHTGVWHLVSEVAGTLRPGIGDAALVRAAFPPGSVTGAPKPAALDVISELESTAREAYTGAIGMASPVAGLELNVAIRTFEAAGGRVWLGVGGGVVADSDPAAEAAECRTKAAPLLAAIGADMAPFAVGAGAAPPPRLGPRPLTRPDPALGVFETVLCAGGRAVAGERHLARLAASVQALYSAALLGDTAERLAAAAAGDPARVRVSAVPSPGGVRIEFERGPLPDTAGPTALQSVTVPGGLGAHKWRDRRLLDALAASLTGAVPLLVDLDGFVLEASRANVVIVEGPRALTPPADGRILPGVTRARLLAAGLVEEAPVALERLAAADAVLLTGALRGAEPVAALDGAPLGRSDAVAARLADSLISAKAPITPG